MAPQNGSAIPPPLAPSQEEAYRRKCIQLRRRMNEVEESNDAARLRLARMARGIEKMRLERAFLLEQLAKRTSTNVEDSDGSPSPPPTPKEKPLRNKRSHGRPLVATGDGRLGGSFVQQGPVTLSPSSDAFSHTFADPNPYTAAPPAKAYPPPPSIVNGRPSHITSNMNTAQPKRPRNAFDVYYNETRPRMAEAYSKEVQDGSFDIDKHLASSWQSLDEVARAHYQRSYDDLKRQWDSIPALDSRDDDVEMGEDEEVSQSDAGASGFTAVNRG